MSEPLRVLLVEDNEAYRETLAYLLAARDEIDVVGGVPTGAEAVRASVELFPDVAVVDLRLPDMGGAEAAAAVREASPATSVVFLSASAGAGESGSGRRVVRKDEGLDALLAAIRASAGRSE